MNGEKDFACAFVDSKPFTPQWRKWRLPHMSCRGWVGWVGSGLQTTWLAFILLRGNNGDSSQRDSCNTETFLRWKYSIRTLAASPGQILCVCLCRFNRWLIPVWHRHTHTHSLIQRLHIPPKPIWASLSLPQRTCSHLTPKQICFSPDGHACSHPPPRLSTMNTSKAQKLRQANCH